MMKNVSNGLWLTVLLPSCVITSSFKYSPTSEIYKTSSIITIGLLINALFGLFHREEKPFRQIGLIVSSLVLSLIFTLYADHGILLNLIFSILTSVSYHPILLQLIIYCPSSFTYGEASIVAQACLLFLVSSFINISSAVIYPCKTCFEIATLILQVGLIGILIICISCFMIRSLRHTLSFYTFSLGIFVGGIIPALHFLLGFSPLLWIIDLLTKDVLTVVLVSYWILCCAAAVLIIAIQIKMSTKASTSVRKYFHVLAVSVFTPGLVVNPCLIYLSSGIVFALFISIELSRILRLPPLGNSLQEAFQNFADEKDEGPLALTPIYLLVGCSIPVWIHPHPVDKCDLIPLLAGILSIGIGDTAASVFGSKFGRRLWPGTRKTKEGTVACILSQTLFLVTLVYFNVLTYTCIFHPITAITIISLVEAKTDQVDNIALPLLMYLLLIL
ncbi:dolichol kinase isoform X2 [Bemisia tabaci]|uniref:dolichol kinase isoform X2 n=1 Tax=Bemisia tabaci TaxID=7038 RepID=UPI003B2875DA